MVGPLDGKVMYDETYRAVMERAVQLAEADKGVINPVHLLYALLQMHPEAMAYFFHKPLAEPHYYIEVGSARKDVKFSSSVNQMLNPCDGIVYELSRGVCRSTTLTAHHIAAALLVCYDESVQDFLCMNGLSYEPELLKNKVLDQMKRFEEKRLVAEYQRVEYGRMQALSRIKRYLQSICFGQDAAIDRIINALSAFWSVPPMQRHGRPLNICLVGAPGTGKTHLVTHLKLALEKELGIASPEFVEMKNFSNEQLAIDMIGRDTSWRSGGNEGVLTGHSYRYPTGVIHLENLDMAHSDALAYVEKMVTDGVLMDELTSVHSYFYDNIVISTLSLRYRELPAYLRLAANEKGEAPSDKIVELISNYVKNELNRQNAGALCSILNKMDLMIPFQDHQVASTRHMIRNAISSVHESLSALYSLEYKVEELELLFLESMQRIGSATPILPLVSEAMQESVYRYCIDSAEGTAVPPTHLRFEVEALPDLGASFGDFPQGSDAWIEARTKKRQQMGRRLVFSTSIQTEGDTVVVSFKDLRYLMLPNIEDSDFFSVRVPDVRREDLVGLDIAWKNVHRALSHIFSGRQTAVTPQYGILLCGPPGTGKTSFAKAVASELGVPFIYASAADLCTSHPAVGVKRVQQMFAAAHRTGSIIFMDEIDALGSRDNSHGMYDVIINALLTELDGFNSRHVLVIAATNRPDTLDPALVRNGRLHTRIYLGRLKKEEDRSLLISKCVEHGGAVMEEDVLRFAVQCTNDWAPSNIKSLISYAIEKSQDGMVSRNDILRALHREYFGEETQKLSLSAAKVHHVAVHESGHALACTLLNFPWIQVTINSGGNALGYLQRVHSNDCNYTAEQIRRQIQICLAGRAAECLLSTPAAGAHADIEHAMELAGHIVDERLDPAMDYSGMGYKMAKRESAIHSILESCERHVSALLQRHLPALQQTVKELLDNRILLHADVERILNDCKNKD